MLHGETFLIEDHSQFFRCPVVSKNEIDDGTLVFTLEGSLVNVFVDTHKQSPEGYVFIVVEVVNSFRYILTKIIK